MALAEHLPYKLLLHEYDYLEEQFPKIRALGDYCRSWGDEEIGVYLDYTSRCFAYAHARDLGQEAEKPVLPKQFQDEPLLDIFVLGDYYKRVVLNIG